MMATWRGVRLDCLDRELAIQVFQYLQKPDRREVGIDAFDAVIRRMRILGLDPADYISKPEPERNRYTYTKADYYRYGLT